MTDSFSEGTRVWLVVGKTPDDWIPATVTQNDSVEIVLKSDYGQEKRMWCSEADSSVVRPMNSTMSEGLDDMAKMSELNQASILCNLNTRYQNNKIYTYIGSILISVNPYKQVQGLYDADKIDMYRDQDLGDRPPHVFAIANECYSCMWKREENQCVLISGESGAGKTEATKFMLRFMSDASHKKASRNGPTDNGRNTSIEQSILNSGPLLEAFGNAKTVYNNNSSRFGKFIQLLFSKNGVIQGGRITDYLLEKHRVVRQNPGERNYHIFYNLLTGLEQDKKDALYLGAPGDYNYLNSTNCISDPQLDDLRDWHNLTNALKVIGFKHGQCEDMQSVLAGILHLGNIEFMNAGGAQVANTDVVDTASQLLGVDNERLESVLKERTMKLRGENIASPQSIDQACDSRDSISMALYSQLFRWMISKINHKIKGPDDFHFIGILDIFGFENFEVNRFEQFCINFANEKLQEFFNRHIFSLEQLEYNREGIDWCDVEWTDNSECLDLIEKNMGILSLINEESRFPKGTDTSLLNKLHSQHQSNSFYVKPRVSGIQYGIRHYAGEVFYTITGFLEKNRDTFRDDLLTLLKDSSNDLIYELFEKVRGNSEASGKGRGKKTTTMSGQFKQSLHSLMQRLSSANPFFVRCIKPNMEKVPDNFQAGIVLNQLKYSGMLETVRVRRAGYPVRRVFQDFIDRYWMILKMSNLPNDPVKAGEQILSVVDEERKLWKLGKTKIFLKEILEQKLEKVRAEKVNRAAVTVQAVLRAVGYRRRYLKMKKVVVHIQRHVRGFIARSIFKRTVRALVLLQRVERGRKARVLFRAMLAEKRERDRIKLEATIVIQKYARGFIKRKMFKVLLEKHRQLKALKEQMEREKREKLERERREREEKAREEEERLAKLREQEELEIKQRKEEEEEAARQKALELKLAAQHEAELANKRVQETPSLFIPPHSVGRPITPNDEFPSPNVSPLPPNIIGYRETRQREELYSRPNKDSHRNKNIPRFSYRPENDILADLDAVLKDADEDLTNGDSAYSTVNKRAERDQNSIQDIYDLTSDMMEDEREEIERILQLEREINELQRVSEPPSPVAAVENEEVYDMVDENTETFHDLGFEELENHIGDLIDQGVVKEITPIQSDEEAAEENPYGSLPDENTESYYPDSDSYFTDTSFEDDDDEDGDWSGADTMTMASSTPDSHWRPSVYFHGYLYVRGGLMNQWKRRWCVLRDDMLMLFRSKQEGIKCGWMLKKSSSSKMGSIRGTLPRKAWQKRWFVLDEKEMKYYDNDEENTKSKGTIDILHAREISDDTEKENGLDVIISSSKTHHLAAENEDDATDWFTILTKMHTSSPEERAQIEKAAPNPRNATGVVEVRNIENVNAAQLPGKQHTFVLTTSQRVYTFAAENNEEMHHWITMLNESKSNTSSHEGNLGVGLQGWLYRGTQDKSKISYQRRWFKLKQNAIEFYKTPDSSQKLGSLALNSLCIVTAADENQQKLTGLWEIVVYGRKHTLRMSSKLYNDALNWYNEIQSTIDSHTMVVTRTEQLLRKIKEVARNGTDKDLDLLYKRNPVLRQSEESLRSPLLPLPYEQIRSREDHFTLRDEAIRLFSVMLSMEEATYQSIGEEAQALQNILACLHDLSMIQDEFYLQLIKQTSVYEAPLVSKDQLQSDQHVSSCPHYWHLIACMCCAYHPSQKVVQYLKFHLKRVQVKYPESPAAQYAGYAEEALSRTRHRENVPSVEEIIAILELKSLVTTIYCYGGATCEIQIDSATTAGEVVKKLLRGMQLENNSNTFGLFERCGSEDRAIDNNTIVADVIAKFEKLNTSQNSNAPDSQWILYFKLFCIFDPMNAPIDSIEFLFLFEEIHEQMIHGLYPVNDDMTRQLSALRLQFVDGDYHKINWDKLIEQYYPVVKMRRAYELPTSNSSKDLSTTGADSSNRRSSFSLGFGDDNKNTSTKKKSSAFLNSLKKRTIRSKVKEEGNEMNLTLFTEELQDVKSNVADRWYKLKGMPRETAVVEYVQLARTWPGFGSSLFMVRNNGAVFGESALTLGVANDGIRVYKQGSPTVLDYFPYTSINSFGVQSANVFQLHIEGRGEILLVTEHVSDIVKLMRAYVSAHVRRKRAK